jgi:hypothetical protein
MIRAPFRQLALAQRHTVANGRRAMTDSANQMRENLKKLQGSMPTPPAGGASALTSLLALGGVGYVLYSSIFTVDPGRRAIIWSMIGGLKDQVYGEGFHFRIPYIDRPIMFDVRTRPRKIESMTGSKDMQVRSRAVARACVTTRGVGGKTAEAERRVSASRGDAARDNTPRCRRPQRSDHAEGDCRGRAVVGRPTPRVRSTSPHRRSRAFSCFVVVSRARSRRW